MGEEPKSYPVGTLSYTRPTLAVLVFWLMWGNFCYMLFREL